MPRSALPVHLRDKLHDDWTWPFSLISRNWTSYKLFQPPVVIVGRRVKDWVKGGPNPCQRYAWSWYISWPLYFTITFGKSGWYMRIGCRWDDVDSYYTIPSFVIKKIEGVLHD